MKYCVGQTVKFYKYHDIFSPATTLIGVIKEARVDFDFIGNYCKNVYVIDTGSFEVDVNENDIIGYFSTKQEKRKMREVIEVNLEIVDYKVFNDNKAVVVYFADGTEERAVRDDKDVFDLERAIEVCCMKKLFGGSGAYNRMIRTAVKQVKAIDAKRAADKAEKERLAKKREKDIERKIKRKEKKRQEQIDIYKEAYIKAMTEMKSKLD